MNFRLLAMLCVFAAHLAAAQPIPSGVTSALTSAGLGVEHIGIAVLPVSGDRHGVWHNSNTPMQPASTMKLVTSVTALELLGPNYKGSTELLLDGRIRQGVLEGSVVLRGRGDADLDASALWSLLERLRAQGVHEIRGNVLLDRSFFSPARFDLGLPPFDESPEEQYNVIPDALYLNHGILNYQFVADEHQLRVRTEPALYGLTVRSKMQLVDGLCKDWDEQWQPADVTVRSPGSHLQVVLNGKFPRNCSTDAELQLFDRDLLANRLIRQVWAQLGGVLRGKVLPGLASDKARVVAKHEARPLAEVLRHMNKASDNPLTRLIYLSLGATATEDVRREANSTHAVSAARVKRWFAEHQIATDGMVLDNGSGLSRSERITPMQMAQMLRAAWQKNYAPELISSMPLVGVDGTMRNRLKASAASGRARIKTGTLRNTTAIAGYVPDADQQWWVVVAMINHDKAEAARPALDALIDWVATRRSSEIVGEVANTTQ